MTPPQRRTEGGDALLAALSRHGVQHLFSVSGGPINSAYHAATRQPVEIVHVRHESAGVFMADARYRATGRPGVVLATLGPGVANTAPPAASSRAAGVPLLIVGGQASTSQLHRGAGMELPTMELMAPAVKWAAQVLHAERIPEFVDEAWRRMLAGTPGPVYLEIPVDVLSAEAEVTTPTTASAPEQPAPSSAAVARIADTLRGARRPLMIAGDGVFHAGASSSLRRLVESADLAVTTMRLARGAVDETTDPRWIGPGYIPANPALARALAEADVVLLLGHHWEFDLEYGRNVPAQTTVIQVHRDAAMLGRNGRVDVPVAADAGQFLAGLSDVAGQRDGAWVSGLATEWAETQSSLIAADPPADGDARPHPLEAIDAVLAAVPPGARVVTSHGNVDFWADARVRRTEPGRYLRMGQSGALGAEIPLGVGAALDDGRPSVVFVGDGGVGYHVTELDTAARHQAPVVVVVLDDHSWGAIALPQRADYGVEVALDLPGRDWPAVAQALGGTGTAARSLADVGPAIEKALASGGPAIVQIPVRRVLSPYMRHIS